MPVTRRVSRALFERLWLVEKLGGQQIADRLGVHRSTVTEWARAFDMPLRLDEKVARRVIPQHRLAELLDMWRCRVKAAEIGQHFGCDTRTVYNTVRRLGGGNRGKGSSRLFLSLEEYLAQELARRLARDAAAARSAWAEADMVDSPQAFQRLARRAP